MYVFGWVGHDWCEPELRKEETCNLLFFPDGMVYISLPWPEDYPKIREIIFGLNKDSITLRIISVSLLSKSKIQFVE